METHFASADRSEPDILERELRSVRASPVIEALLDSVSGMLAVLNRHRQVLAVNSAFIEELGIEDPELALGLRLGEAVDCLHATAGPGGCGTSEYCATCGAAIAIVTAQGFAEPVERICALRALRNGRKIDLCLRVRAAPIRIDGAPYLLLFLRDVTDDWNRAALERIFFHDINNILGGLMTATALLESEHGDTDLMGSIRRLSLRLAREVAFQSGLVAGDDRGPVPEPSLVTVNDVLDEVGALFSLYPVACDKELHVVRSERNPTILVDEALLLRVLGNMVTNALEASGPGDRVEMWVEEREGRTEFQVWNHLVIDESVALRIFQRNFSTKDGEGRGLGTFSMRLIGETYLGGEVGFASGAPDGTVFWLSLPS